MQQELKGLDLADVDHFDLVAGSVKKAMKDVGASSSDLWKVPADSIKILPDFNVRVDTEDLQAHIEWLKDSIRAEGLKDPLIGYVRREGDADVVYVTDGHCRLTAIRQLIAEGVQIDRVPMTIMDRSVSEEDLVAGLLLFNSGKSLTPYETGIVFKRLKGYGWDEKKIAKQFGKTTTYVSQLLTLMGAPREIRQLVAIGKVAAATAHEVFVKHGAAAVEILMAGLATAASAGKTKVTAKHLPDVAWNKALKRQAPAMLDSINSVRADAAYQQLSAETRARLDDLEAHLKETKAKLEKLQTTLPLDGDGEQAVAVDG